MLLGIIQFITLVFIIASFILQMLVLLGNFPGLRSVYISRVDLVPVEGSTNVFIESIKELLFTSVPDYLTVSILRLCEGYNKDSSKNMCTPPSLGFQYSKIRINL